MELLRIIHPIGQGAFYTEDLAGSDGHKANVVFDCGTTTQKEKRILYQETQAWQLGNNIDLLFISHFDDDHVNGIGYLIHAHKINRVVIPQILGYEWFWFLEDASQSKAWGKGRQINGRLFDFVRALARQRSIRIIEVAPMSNEPWKYESLYQIDNRRNIDEEDANDFPIWLGRSQVRGSGSIITLEDVKAWEYVPFNFTMGKDIDKLKKAVNTILHNELAQLGCSSIEQVPYRELINVLASHLPELNNAYISVFDKSNKSSLCVYSGYIGKTSGIEYWLCHDDTLLYGRNEQLKEACIFTGDSILNKNAKMTGMLSMLGKRLPHVGTFLLPHHGAHGNFSEPALNLMNSKGCWPFVFFASYGHGNRFRHPSATLFKMLRNRGLYVFDVNETPQTKLTEHFVIQ